jgi:hypothetical protein
MEPLRGSNGIIVSVYYYLWNRSAVLFNGLINMFGGVAERKKANSKKEFALTHQ